MNNVSFIKVKDIEGKDVEHAIIDRGNGEYTSMLRSTYDELQAELEASKVVDEAAPE
jgi:5'(3')-deoxyribonucleotidase